MGQYSLENYEQYKTKKCRPTIMKKAGKKLHWFQVEWSLCEQKPGRYEFLLPDFTNEEVLWVIELIFTAPLFGSKEVQNVLHFIRQAGSFYKVYPRFGGVLLTLPTEMDDSKELLWAAFTDAFAPLWIIADSKSPQLTTWLQEKHYRYGLLLLEEESWICVREFLARHLLQRVWEHAPVYAALSHTSDFLRTAEICKGFHVMAADAITLQGAQLIPKRITFPQTVSSKGAMPVRLWWDNCGDCPLYGEYTTHLYLKGESETEIVLSDRKKGWALGDSTYHEIVLLPYLKSGSYTIYIQVLDSNGVEVPLSIKTSKINNSKGCWYCLDCIAVDEIPRPELFTAWDHYYPEGYYPLEDPAQPE